MSDYAFPKTDHERSPSPDRSYAIDSARRGSPATRRSRSRSPRGSVGGGSASGGFRLSTRRLFLSNIPYECDWRKMKDLVKDELGEECFVDIAVDRRGKNLGFGLLEFRTFDAAEKCIDRMNNAEVNGRRMIVREMTRRDEERWQEVQRDKNASNGASSDRHHSEMRSYGPDIPPAMTQIMRRHGIDPPMSKSLFVANVAFECDERRLREIFSYAGRVTMVDLKREPDGASRGFGLVEMDSEFEALQAICMFNGASIYDRALKVRFDVKADGISSKYPPGVKNLGPGFGPGGEPLPHIGVLHSLPELLQLVSPTIFVDILNRAGYSGTVGSAGSGALNATSIATLAAAIAQQTQSQTPAPHHYHDHRTPSLDSAAMPPPSSSYGGYGGSWVGGPSAPGGAQAGGHPMGRNEPCSVVASNLPPNATWRQLKERFCDVGEIVVADIVNRTQNSTTGLVRFASPGDAKRAVRLLHEARFEGRQMDVRLDF